MIEIIVERWTGLDGQTSYIWTLWRDGRRVEMGAAQPSATEAESEAKAFCLKALGQEADRLTTL